MKKLAIRNHETRRREVFAFLEMLGARRVYDFSSIAFAFTIDFSGDIDALYGRQNDEFRYFSLESIETLYPYKVGDKVSLNEDLHKELSSKSQFKEIVRKDVYEIMRMYWIADLEDFRYDLRGIDCTIRCVKAKDLMPLVKEKTDKQSSADFNVVAHDACKNAVARHKTEFSPNHEKDVLSILEELSEFAKASEEKPSEHLPEYTEAAEELADIIIGCMTELYKRNVDVGSIIRDKMNFNETRQS